MCQLNVKARSRPQGRLGAARDITRVPPPVGPSPNARSTPDFMAAIAAALLTPSSTASPPAPSRAGLIDLAAPGANPISRGATAGDNAARRRGPRDVNGDGLPTPSSRRRSPTRTARTDSGSVYVVYGRLSGGRARPAVAAFRERLPIDGGTAGDRFGSAVAAAGTSTATATPTLVVGAPQADPSGRANAGSTYVIYGAPAKQRTSMPPRSARAAFRIDGAAAGDLNGQRRRRRSDVKRRRPAGRRDRGLLLRPDDGAAQRRVRLRRSRRHAKRRPRFRATPCAPTPRCATTPSAPSAFVPDTGGDGHADLAVGAPAADPGGRAGAGSAWVAQRPRGRRGRRPSRARHRGSTGGVAGDALGTLVRTIPDVSGDGKPSSWSARRGADANPRGELRLAPLRQPRDRGDRPAHRRRWPPPTRSAVRSPPAGT